ncbi:hypothetical protein GGTG_07389 [Gaeumannomyces tritici R3-111a-1]|uniref:Uncharacterized protein n=1 Tax=Gaeumannomyces tritici (strain R3-111a-1) TaxID=644352 RepID=J3P1J1_GAET3|nr:hypothetical protein GGTG_07389 [Gaeumannomyces tritici R3-111a-1]EJT73533.1 hypothetical protein GGTG_07389 [Gaeumannomyces tritici R3-111a-1]
MPISSNWLLLTANKHIIRIFKATVITQFKTLLKRFIRTNITRLYSKFNAKYASIIAISKTTFNIRKNVGVFMLGQKKPWINSLRQTITRLIPFSIVTKRITISN